MDTNSKDWLSEERINSLRGFACIMLIGSHVIGDSLDYLHLQSPTWVVIDRILTPIRMPLFSFLSGFIYAYRPAQWVSLPDFELKKVKRLLIPCVIVTLLIMCMKLLTPNTANPISIEEIPGELLYGYSHLWFLQALFTVFLIVAVSDAALSQHLQISSLALLLVGLVMYFTPVRTVGFFSIGKAFYLLPYFALGICCNRFRGFIHDNKNSAICALGICAVVLSAMLLAESSIDYRADFRAMMLGISGVVFLLLVFPTLSGLAAIGVYSYTIYLFHSLFTAVANKVAPNLIYILIPLSFALSLFAPIAIEVVITRYLPMFGFVIGKSGGSKRRVA